jgi:hypothetical protein
LTTRSVEATFSRTAIIDTSNVRRLATLPLGLQ